MTIVTEENVVENHETLRVHIRRLEENDRFNYEVAVPRRSENWRVQTLNLNGEHPFAFTEGKVEFGGQEDVTLKFSNLNGGHCQIDL